MPRTEEATQTTEGYCPHCQLLVEHEAPQPWPPRPAQCPHCHLLIGAGRGRTEPSGDPGTKGTAAGVFSRQAKRDDTEGEEVPPETVLEAIRAVAGDVGERPERLLMVDYQQMAASDPELPPLRAVFAAYGSWKRARHHAAQLAGAEGG